MRKNFSYRNAAHQLLAQWMKENNLEGDYVIHHRDDTEECRAYNAKDAHYKMWGFNLDGTFEYGKYIVYMTRAEHMSHHRTGKHLTEGQKIYLSKINSGENSPMWGKHHSDETRKILSAKKMGNKNPMYEKDFTPEHRLHLRESYAGHRPEVLEKNRESNRKRMLEVSALYKEYKSNGGKLSWCAFRHALATGALDENTTI